MNVFNLFVGSKDERDLTEHQDVDFPDLGMNEHTWACIRRIYDVLHVDANGYLRAVHSIIRYHKGVGVK